MFDILVKNVRLALSATPHGRKLLASWKDSQIKSELKDPCFFGAKNPLKTKEHAVKHFEKLADMRK